jgi:hypothetical protein
MSKAASKRRICSYDMLEVRPDGYTLTETEGEMYFRKRQVSLYLGGATCYAAQPGR